MVEYVKTGKLGAGTFGFIYKVMVKNIPADTMLGSTLGRVVDGEYAMKKISIGLCKHDIVADSIYISHANESRHLSTIESINSVIRVNLIKEIIVLADVEARGGHANIVSFIGYLLRPTSTHLFYSVMQYDLQQLILLINTSKDSNSSKRIKCESTIVETICDNDILTIHDIEILLASMLRGLSFLHDTLHLLHRDIKPGNILIGFDGVVQIADFGLVTSNYTDITHTVIAQKSIQVGTRWYKAPEIVVRHELYSYPVDMWSMGCIALELFLGRPVFESQSDFELQCKIISLFGYPSHNYWPAFTTYPDLFLTRANSLIEYNGTPDDWSRIKLSLDLQLTPKFDDILSNLLALNPDNRLTAQTTIAKLSVLPQTITICPLITKLHKSIKTRASLKIQKKISKPHTSRKLVFNDI